MEVAMQPTAHIAVNRNRVKIHDGKNIFLKNGQEFEFELFNPTQDRIVAKIKVNGKEISNNNSGIIIEPGRRIYLERYLDTPKKFQFQTYEVEDGNKVVDNAISRNGDIEVTFHREVKPMPQVNFVPVVIKEVPIIIREIPNRWWNQPYYGTPTTASPFLGGSVTSQSTTLNYKGDTKCCSDDLGFNGLADDCYVDNAPEERSRSFAPASMNLSRKLKSAPETKETGMVGQGNYSSQSMKTVDMQFESFAFCTVTYKIHPESRKEYVTKDDVEMYCSNCGRKKKKETWKFCPGCGVKL